MNRHYVWLLILGCVSMQAADRNRPVSPHTPDRRIIVSVPNAPARPALIARVGGGNNNNRIIVVRNGNDFLNAFNQAAGNVGNPNIEADPYQN